MRRAPVITQVCIAHGSNSMKVVILRRHEYPCQCRVRCQRRKYPKFTFHRPMSSSESHFAFPRLEHSNNIRRGNLLRQPAHEEQHTRNIGRLRRPRRCPKLVRCTWQRWGRGVATARYLLGRSWSSSDVRVGADVMLSLFLGVWLVWSL